MMARVFSLSQKNTENTENALGSAREAENLSLELKTALTQFRYS